MNGNRDWEKMGHEIQDRLWQATPTTIESAKVLRRQLLSTLSKAVDDDILEHNVGDIHKLLQLAQSRKDGKEFFVITGGPNKSRNTKRSKDFLHFKRADGCWFDFSIIIDQKLKPAQLYGFTFEIRFPNDVPDDVSVKFLRFDLNPPGHDNAQRGIRFHLHPGHENLMIPSPPLCPLEILHLFLYGLSIPDRPRSI